MEKKILKTLLCIGLLLFPFAFKRENLKENLLIFFLKGYLSSFIATVLVKNKNISYPIRLMPKYFSISVVFDYLLFPILCIFFNQTSLNSRPLMIVFQSLLYSMPMTILEVLFEKYTDLIKYKHHWNWLITYSTLTTTLLVVRVFISFTRKLSLEGAQNKSQDNTVNLKEM
ncbi:CBO0543 family protein [Metabacillus sp. HB246100]